MVRDFGKTAEAGPGTSGDLPGGDLVLFTSRDGAVSVTAALRGETVWLTQEQMAQVFQVQRPAITKHLRNIYRTGELAEESTCSIMEHLGQEDRRSYPVRYYNLDAIIAVGYRVNSQRATQFRVWASSVLKDYILRGYAVNRQRLEVLGQVVRVLRRAEGALDAGQVLSVVERYARALDLLDAYDHQGIRKPEGRPGGVVLVYEECRAFVDALGFRESSPLFGREKDDSFRGTLGAIYQTFGGVDVYPTLEEKAAHLLYFIVKNHSFVDGNKRIAAALFLHFLHRSGRLFAPGGEKVLADHTLVALTLLVAESRPSEREAMIHLIMTFLQGKGDDSSGSPGGLFE